MDAAAKKAAGMARVPAKVIKLLDTAARAVEFYAAKLGEVTHAAHNLRFDVVLPDGNTTKRDSAGHKPATRSDGIKSAPTVPRLLPATLGVQRYLCKWSEALQRRNAEGVRTTRQTAKRVFANTGGLTGLP